MTLRPCYPTPATACQARVEGILPSSRAGRPRSRTQQQHQKRHTQSKAGGHLALDTGDSAPCMRAFFGVLIWAITMNLNQGRTTTQRPVVLWWPCTPHFGGQFDAAGWRMNENMVDHFTSDRGLAVGAEPHWMLGITADLSILMCRKSLKNNDLPPPPTKSSLAPRTKLSTSQQQPTDRARPFGSAWVWPHGPKTLVRPNGLRLYAESLGSVRSTYRSRANSARPCPYPSSSRHDTPPPSKDRGHLALVEGETPASPDPSRIAQKASAKWGVVYGTLLLTSTQRSKKCRY